MTRTISLADDAYDALVAVKRSGESFSELARRLAREEQRRSIWSLAGRWGMSDDEADRLKADLRQIRDESGAGRQVYK